MTTLLLRCLGIAIAYTIYTICYAVYNLFFHPLRNFPGPKLAAATQWYEFYFDMCVGQGGQFAWEVDRMHEIYGPIVRVNPNELHVHDPDWYEVLHAGNPTHRDKYFPFAAIAPKASFGTISHQLHRKRKLATSPMYSKRAVTSAESLIQKHAEKICKTIYVAYLSKSILQLHTLLLAYSTDSIVEYSFGRDQGLQDDMAEGKEGQLVKMRKADDWSATVSMVGALFPLLRQFPWIVEVLLALPVKTFFFIPVLGRFAQLNKDMKTRAKEFLANEKNNPTPQEKTMERPKTIFHSIYQSTLPKHEKTLKRLSDEAIVLFAAGTESTARTLMFAMYYLLSNPTWLDRLRAELLVVMPDPLEVPSLAALNKLTLLQACIKETFRTSAPLTSRFPLQSPAVLRYKDWEIPPNTPTSMTLRAVLHAPHIFHDPTTFCPSRWLPKSHPLSTADPIPSDRYYVAFSKGTRMCPGMDLSLAEINIALAMMIRRFDLELVDMEFDRDIRIKRDCFLGEPEWGSRWVRVRVKGVFGQVEEEKECGVIGELVGLKRG